MKRFTVAVLPGRQHGPEVSCGGRVLAPAMYSATSSTRRSPSAPRASTWPAIPFRSPTRDAVVDADAVLLGMGRPFLAAPKASPRGARAPEAARGVRQPPTSDGSSRSFTFSEAMASENILIVRELLGGLYYEEEEMAPRRLAHGRRRTHSVRRCWRSTCDWWPTTSWPAELLASMNKAMCSRCRSSGGDGSGIRQGSPTSNSTCSSISRCASPIRPPSTYITENLFGDILSDGAALTGSFSAPWDRWATARACLTAIAGKGIANPIGLPPSPAAQPPSRWHRRLSPRCSRPGRVRRSRPGEATVGTTAHGRTVARVRGSRAVPLSSLSPSIHHQNQNELRATHERPPRRHWDVRSPAMVSEGQGGGNDASRRLELPWCAPQHGPQPEHDGPVCCALGRNTNQRRGTGMGSREQATGSFAARGAQPLKAMIR